MFAVTALFLSGLGIYGVIAYSVSQRTTEMGLRMALGAGESDVVHLVVGASMRVVAIGMAVGIGSALVLTRYLSGQLFGVSHLDPLVFFGVSALLAALALVASFIPARRASQVDPLVALRVE